jgi:hypothetical protein
MRKQSSSWTPSPYDVSAPVKESRRPESIVKKEAARPSPYSLSASSSLSRLQAKSDKRK